MTKSTLGPTASHVIGLYALIAVHGWFVLEYAYPSAGEHFALALSVLKISGLLASAIFVMGTFGAMAMPPIASWMNANCLSATVPSCAPMSISS